MINSRLVTKQFCERLFFKYKNCSSYYGKKQFHQLIARCCVVWKYIRNTNQYYEPINLLPGNAHIYQKVFERQASTSPTFSETVNEPHLDKQPNQKHLNVHLNDTEYLEPVPEVQFIKPNQCNELSMSPRTSAGQSVSS